ncbi:Gamma-interferon-inducible lysosomal thiol reductase [Frankliniella fusca]|uniref:Gamma-interferon-inducible lysosomal thiol reductase n=1 Tax=Frankliniella fusca TaxID=407009 RepID=A0AAE1H3A8_9NEOP|nr:Gamma-interferon-inducible lysosomal thiol reductase [Frankliniella fusca]
MYYKFNTVMKVKIFLLVLAVFIFWSTVRVYYSKKPVPLTRIEIADDGSSTVVTLLPVLVEVYYEALCPDSRSFLLTELLPAYEKIPEAMNVHLIPYGKAKTTTSGNSFKFECQHGPQECLANKVHACGLKLILNADTRVQYVTCMINDNWNPEEAGSRCAKKYELDWDSIWECAKGNEGSKLLSLYGKKTDKLGSIDFVPTIALQGSTDKQPAILKNLFKEICTLYKDEKPEKCSQLSVSS